MSLTPTDLKKGTIFSMGDQIYESLDYKQKVKGRQQSSVTVKARNLKTNKLTTHTFSGSEDLAAAELERRSVDFLYGDGTVFYFMDPQNFEQYEFTSGELGEKAAYLAEDVKVVMLVLNGEALTIELPKNVWLAVDEAEEVVRGDTSATVLKDIRLSTGLIVKAPAFIKVGDIVSVDTVSGTYRERKK